MQLHTILLGASPAKIQFCVFTGSGSPSDEWHHETDCAGNKVVRVEFEIPCSDPMKFNEAIKEAERVATEEYHKHRALRGPVSVSSVPSTDKFTEELDKVIDTIAYRNPRIFGRQPEHSRAAYSSPEGSTYSLTESELVAMLETFEPTLYEREWAEGFFSAQGVKVSDPQAVKAMADKRMKVAEELRALGLSFVGFDRDKDGNQYALFSSLNPITYIKGQHTLKP